MSWLIYQVDRTEHQIIILDVFVEENRRRQGIATALLEEVAQQAYRHRCRRLILDNVLEPENLLYERAGFRYTQPGYDNEMKALAVDVLRRRLFLHHHHLRTRFLGNDQYKISAIRDDVSG